MNLFAGQDRAAMRAAWRTAWQRHRDRLPLSPLQAQMAELVTAHPQFHAQLAEHTAAESEIADAADASGRAFLHLSLHLALREQLATDRPHGIAQLHRQLAAACRAGHEAEHRMMNVLEQTLWEAQRTGKMPEESQYFEALRRL